MDYYEKRTLPNGVRVLAERVPGVRSAALGVWVGVGSRRETTAESGAAHFLEHMAFKGTYTRTAAQLAQDMDAIGGQMNAYTTKENTVYYAWVLDTHLRQAADILSDMLFHSRFDEEDVETERGVILEEMGMYADDPEDLCAERLAHAIYKGCPLARPILGCKSSVLQFTAQRLRDWHTQHYVPSQLVVALAGSFQDDDLDVICQQFAELSGASLPPIKPAVYTPSFAGKRKATEQNHFTIAFPGLPVADPQRFTLQLLSALLGGGMSSRLWQEVREKKGLCYTVSSYGAGYTDIGTFCIYTATSQNTEEQALRAIAQEVQRLTEYGVSQEELNRVREQSKANVMMGLESTKARMSALGRGELLIGQVLSTEEVIAAYDAVTIDDVQNLAQRLLNFDRVSFSAVGRLRTKEEYRRLLP